MHSPRRNPWLVGVLVVALPVVLLTSPPAGTGPRAAAAAPAGGLDPSFNAAGPLPGVVRIGVGPDAGDGGATMLGDGSVVAIGSGLGGSTIARLRPDGSLDPAFNPSGSLPGVVTTTVYLRDSPVVQLGGAIVAVGSNDLLRLLPSGAPDSSFGNWGPPPAPLHEPGTAFLTGWAQRIAATAYGFFTAGAELPSGFAGNNLAVNRVGANGVLDATFGSGGTTGSLRWTIPDSGVAIVGRITMDGAGRALVPLVLSQSGGERAALARFTTAGLLDPTFGSGGVVVHSPLSEGIVDAVPDDAGRLVAVAVRGGGSCFVERLAADGSVDPTYGASGAARLAIGTCGSAAIGIQPTGEAVVARQTARGVVVDRTDGARMLDEITLDLGSDARPLRVLPMADGRIVVEAVSPSAMFVARLLPTLLPIPQTFVSVVPGRVLETRADAGQVGYVGAKPVAGQVIELVVTGGVVPVDAAAVVLNVTGTEASSSGFVTVWPCGEERPRASNLNLVAGVTSPNLVIAKGGVGGKVCLFTQSSAHLLADLAGYFPGGATS